MKKHLFFAALTFVFASPLSAQFKINPKIGVTLSRLASDPADFETTARPGFTAGADVRLGKKFYFQPGIHYSVMNYELADLSTIDPVDVPDETGIKSLKIPLNVGLSIVDLKLFRIRAFGGANFYKVTGFRNNNLGLTKDDFAKNYWGANLGAGLDLLFMTIDLQYEWGQSAIFKNQPDTKYRTIALTAGLKF